MGLLEWVTIMYRGLSLGCAVDTFRYAQVKCDLKKVNSFLVGLGCDHDSK